jgi:hypothetical protein
VSIHQRVETILNCDVILRVATFLLPKDLFALSFTNKLNYQLVASHSLIWHRARLVHMPKRVLPPPSGMTEKEYAWFLTTKRCLKCHLVKPLETDWELRAKCCFQCLDPMREEVDGRMSVRRKRESETEARMVARDYVERVKNLSDDGAWEIAVLNRIPRFKRVVDAKTAYGKIDFATTENAFKLLKSHIAKGLSFNVILTIVYSEVEIIYRADCLDKEIKDKTTSLKLCVREYIFSSWIQRFGKYVERAFLPPSFAPLPPSHFVTLGHKFLDEVLDQFIPPFPIQRDQQQYSPDFLSQVVIPLLESEFLSNFNRLEMAIQVRIQEDASISLRRGILTAAQRQGFLDAVFASKENLLVVMRKDISGSAKQEEMDSMLIKACETIVKEMPIYRSPPFPIDRSCEYSAEILESSIFPALLEEIRGSSRLYERVADLARDVDQNLVVPVFVEQVKAFTRSKNFDIDVLNRIPEFVKLTDTSEISPIEVAFKNITNHISEGLFYII